MPGIDGILIAVLGACFVASFLVELVLNRHPFLVALCVALVAFGFLVVLDWNSLWHEHSVLAGIYAGLALFGGLAALAGSGIARFLRLWLAIKHDDDQHTL